MGSVENRGRGVQHEATTTNGNGSGLNSLEAIHYARIANQ